VNFGVIQQECYNNVYSRFDSSQATNIGYWINDAYARVWAAADWPWKLTDANSVILTPSTRNTNVWASGSMVNLRIAFITDDNNDPVTYVTPGQYFRQYGASPTSTAQESTGHPSVWTWLDGQILWGPIPDSAYVYYVVYERNIFVRDNAGNIINGPWDGATYSVTPAWNEPFHYLLVMGAMATGLLLENDSTTGQMEQAFQSRLEAMKLHYTQGVLANGQLTRDDF
jgi:hypothetical protein